MIIDDDPEVICFADFPSDIRLTPAFSFHAASELNFESKYSVNFGPIYDSHSAFNKKAVNTYIDNGYLPIHLSLPSFFDYGSEPGSPIYVPVKREFKKIYALLMDSSNARDHSLLLQYLKNLNCFDEKSFESRILMIDFDKLVEFMQDGPSRENLLDLLYPTGASIVSSDTKDALITIRVKCQGESTTIKLPGNSTLGLLKALITSDAKLSSILISSKFENFHLMSGFPPVIIATLSSKSSHEDSKLLSDLSITNNDTILLVLFELNGTSL